MVCLRNICKNTLHKGDDDDDDDDDNNNNKLVVVVVVVVTVLRFFISFQANARVAH